MRRTNYAGRPVTLAEGAAVSALLATGTALAGSRRDALVLGAVGALGLADDLLEPRQRRAGRPVAKGLRGHLGALCSGRLTTGGAKALGIPALALLGAAAAPRPRHGAMVAADAILVAGCANLANLLDLRPGRALKAVIPAAAALAVPSASAPARGRRDAGQGHPCGDRDASGRALAIAALVPAAAALLPDLREHGMLGDAGANALGAAVGLAATRRAPRPVRLGLTGLVVALTLASERVSFSAVIDRIPALRAVDSWGRRHTPSGSAEDPDA
nr:hypothetical protein [Brachybacterium epidermidis]